MRIKIVAVGKLKEKYWVDALKEYLKRISRYASVEIHEIAENRTLDDEAKDILKKLSGYVIVTDIKGEIISSEDFAAVFKNVMLSGTSEFTIVIGGSEGLSNLVKEKANKTISFGRVTYPHQMMRAILAEQIYRAVTINNNITYHK